MPINRNYLLATLGVSLILIGVGSVVYSSLLLWPTSSNQGRAEGEVAGIFSPSPQLSPTPIQPVTPSPKVLPLSKTLTGGTQTFQTFNNCGPASLSMLLSHYGLTISQQEIGQQLRPYQHPQGDNDDKSVTLQELAQQAQNYGFIAYRRPAGNMEILQEFIANDIPVITRTWLKPNDTIGHYRVVKGYDRQQGILIQDDSLQGANLRYSYDDFLEIWSAFNYEFLVIVPKEKQQLAESILAEKSNETAAWHQALELAEQQLSTDPNDIYAQFNKSVAQYYIGDYQGSIDSFEKVEGRLPFRMLWYQIEPILAYYKHGDYQKVLSMTDQILNNHNRAFSELYYLRGQIFESQGNQTAAQDAFQKANLYNRTEVWKVNLN